MGVCPRFSILESDPFISVDAPQREDGRSREGAEAAIASRFIGPANALARVAAIQQAAVAQQVEPIERRKAAALAHTVEGDSAWSESYYFNAYDPGADCGFFTRIGIRPNEGTIDAGLSIWVPGGGLAHLRWAREQQ